MTQAPPIPAACWHLRPVTTPTTIEPCHRCGTPIAAPEGEPATCANCCDHGVSPLLGLTDAFLRDELGLDPSLRAAVTLYAQQERLPLRAALRRAIGCFPPIAKLEASRLLAARAERERLEAAHATR